MKSIALYFFAFILLFTGTAAALEQDIAATAEWTPPDLSGLTADSEPQLLLLKVAQEEIGYTEGPLPNESKYGTWFSGGRPAWCAELITWCVDQADQRYGCGMMDTLFPWYGGTKDGAPFFIDKGRFISSDGRLPTKEKQWLIGSETYLDKDGYIPFPGDYIWFFYHSRNRGIDHVALVEGVSRDKDGAIQIHVIEGNNPDRVERAVYALTDRRIYGFGTPFKRAHTNLRIYNHNEDVARLQQCLAELGYYNREEGQDGLFTKEVQIAVLALQKAGGLAASGIVDIETRAFMDARIRDMVQSSR